MHRDIKSENILFAKRGSFNELKLVDFGLATFYNEYPYIFPKCGTPGFVAPEIANLEDKTKPYNVVCDSFSVGVIFHILVTGEAVFPGKKFNEVLKKNRTCEIDFNHTMYQPPMDPLAKDLLIKLLAKEPENRFNATQALNHPYFAQFNKDKFENEKISLDSINEQEISPMRPLGYQKLQGCEDMGSFMVLLTVPETQTQMNYTIGSLDQKINNTLTLDKMLEGDIGGKIGGSGFKKGKRGSQLIAESSQDRSVQLGEHAREPGEFSKNVFLPDDVVLDKTNKQ